MSRKRFRVNKMDASGNLLDLEMYKQLLESQREAAKSEMQRQVDMVAIGGGVPIAATVNSGVLTSLASNTSSPTSDNDVDQGDSSTEVVESDSQEGSAHERLWSYGVSSQGNDDPFA